MVDHHQVNTGPRTRAAMLVRPGSHHYRVIAANRYGVRSSPARAFAAINLPHLHFYPDGVSIHFNKSQSQDIVVGGAAALGVILTHYAPPGLKGLARQPE